MQFFYHRHRRSHVANLTLVAASVLIAALATAAVVYAHGNATGIVKERMEMMESLGKASKAMAKMIKGEVAYRGEAMAKHARTINSHSQEITEYFPEGSLQQASEALPVIWERWDEFERLTRQLEASSAKLIDVAQNGDRKAARRQFTRVAKSCKGCHEDFRQKKE